MEAIVKCIAVDDEAPALKIIEQFVHDTPGIKLDGLFRNPLKAAEWLAQNTVDILFLDIQMPQQTGIEMLKGLKHKPVVIFTTAFSEFATDAFDLDAVDYLRKPFAYARFLRAVNKAREHIAILHKPLESPDSFTAGEDYITIKSDGKLMKVFFSDIVYVEGFQEYIKVYTTTARHITYERMKNIEAILPASLFMRVHRSYIVSLKHVKAITGNLLEIERQQIPVSKDLKEELLRRAF